MPRGWIPMGFQVDWCLWNFLRASIRSERIKVPQECLWLPSSVPTQAFFMIKTWIAQRKAPSGVTESEGNPVVENKRTLRRKPMGRSLISFFPEFPLKHSEASVKTLSSNLHKPNVNPLATLVAASGVPPLSDHICQGSYQAHKLHPDCPN